MAAGNPMSTPSEGWQAGINALSQGKAQEAVDVLQAFVAGNPNSFEGNNYLGVALAQIGKHDEAIRYLQTAARLNPQSAQARYNMGLAQQGAGRTDYAKREYEAALRLDSKHTASQIALAKLDAGFGNAAMRTPAPAGGTPWSSAPAATEQMGAQQIADMERRAKPHAGNILAGFATGLVAAIVCAFIWDKLTYYTGYQIGYVAIGVGFAVGTATMIGASGKRGISLQIVSGLLSLFGILLGET